MVTDACKAGKITQNDHRFTRKEVRDHSGWGNTQLKVHIKRLEEMEYLLIHRGSRGQSFIYELLYSGEGESGQRFQQGLLNLNDKYDKKKSGLNGELSGSSRPLVGTKSVGSQIHQDQNQQDIETLIIEDEGKDNINANGYIASYPHSLAASV